MTGNFRMMCIAAAGILFVSGCGYTTRSVISASYKTVYVVPFTNNIDLSQETYVTNAYRIYRPGLETEVSRAVINKFQFDGTLRPETRDAADLILEGVLAEFRRDPVRYDDNDDVSEYRINIVVDLKLKDARTGETVWEESGFTGDETYFVSGAQAKSESTAVQDALTDLARRIVERTVEQW